MRDARNRYARIKDDGGEVCAYCICQPCSCAAEWINPPKRVRVDTLCGCGKGIINGEQVGRGRCRCKESGDD